MTDLEYHRPLSNSATGEDGTVDLMNRISDLQMQTTSTTMTVNGEPVTPVVSVLAALAGHSRYFSPFLLNDGNITSFSDISSSFLRSLGFLTPSGLDHDSAAHLAGSLRELNLFSEASKCIQMMPDREENAGIMHLQALIAAERGEVEGAMKAFVKVAGAIREYEIALRPSLTWQFIEMSTAECRNASFWLRFVFTDANHPSLDLLRQMVEPDECDQPSSYYRLAIRYLDSTHADLAVAALCQLAIEAYRNGIDQKNNDEEDEALKEGEKGPVWLREIWYKAFRSYTASGYYDEAYFTMMSMPFQHTLV